MQREIGDAEIVSDERLPRLRRADETDRESADRCRARRALAQPLDKAVERGRRVADGDDRAGEIVAPDIDRRGRAGGAEWAGQGVGARIAAAEPDGENGRASCREGGGL